MALLLNIDTATETATISISDNDTIIQTITNTNQKEHASFLQPAIKSLFEMAGLSINKLNAVSVTSGPGSYTGLRVGMASTKGLCYALNIPMITVSTLEVMALSIINRQQDERVFYCPMIDARRMEVFTAIYNKDLSEIIKPCSIILDNESFKDILNTNKVCFSGSGAQKFNDITSNKNALFVSSEDIGAAMALLSYQHFIKKDFADVLYSSPRYLKEFYTAIQPTKLQ